MKTIVYVLCAVFSVTTSGCNNKKPGTENEPEPVDTLSVKYDHYISEDDYTPYKPAIDLFQLYALDSTGIAFVSLSEIYTLSEHPDSIAIPDIEEKGFDAAQYFRLESKYRDRFLSGTGISETDSVFVYDYINNNRASFLVEELNVAAQINPYSGQYDWPFDQLDYMIGFEVDKRKLKGFEEYFYNVLVYVGKENPFAEERLIPVKWKKISAKDFPSKEIQEDYDPYIENTIPGNTYLFETDSLQYFLQDCIDSNDRVFLRRLLVVDSKTKDIIIDKIFGRGEGTSLSPLNYQDEYEEVFQWTGKLLKNKPPVVFGFELVSFGFPFISVIDKSGEDIYTYCDNRH